MYLTPEEEAMYAGEEGPGVQTAMKLLVALGEVFDAPRMVISPISGAMAAIE